MERGGQNMLQDSSGDAERQAARGTCGGREAWPVEIYFRNAKSTVLQTQMFTPVFLPPYLIQYLPLPLFARFSQLGGFGAVTQDAGAASDEKAAGAEGFRLLMTHAKMFYFFSLKVTN